MLKLLKKLFGGWSHEETAPQPRDPDDRVHFAGVILSEVKLYDGKLLQGLSQDLALMDSLRTALQRAYRMYVDRIGGNALGEKVFREAAVRILANGNASLLEPALSEVLREARDPAARGDRLPEEN